MNTGTDGTTEVFADGEDLSSNYGVTHTTSYSVNTASATTYTSAFSVAAGSSAANLGGSTGPAAATGSAVKIESGVYYIRGHFVECSEETLVLDKYTNNPSYRVGFTITETLLAPEDDSTLLLDDTDTSTPNSSTEGKPIWESTASFAISTFDDQEQSTDPSANNVGIETVADSIIDFTEGNPFSEGNI